MKNVYMAADRLIDMMNREVFSLESFCSKWEVSRSTVFRDMKHLNEVYDIRFEYNADINCYEKRHKRERKNV